MITIKDKAGFERMAVAGQAVVAVHQAVAEAAAPGVTMKELDEVAAEVLSKHGCAPSFLGYHGFPAHICTSPNDTIVHGIPGNYRLEDGDILSIDAGAIYEGYHGDGAFTMAVGEVPERVQELIAVTKAALDAGVEQARAGSRIGDIGHAVQRVAESAGFSVVREYVGHGIGNQMHEAPQIPNYGAPGTGIRLKEGMAICIEPMVNMGGWETRVLDDGWTVVTADGALSAHFEHTIAITADGPQVLTA